MYEAVLETEELKVELKHIDEIEKDKKMKRDIAFQKFLLEHFSDARKVENEGYPQLKIPADTELHELEKCTIQIDMNT